VNAALTRFRVMAYVTGTMLLVLVVVAMPLKYLGHSPTLVSIVGPTHGFLYMVYLVTGFDLAVRNRWSFRRTLLLLFGGVVPALSFFAERKATGWVRDEQSGAALARTGAGSATG
jgi:integral membrane protein